MAGPGRTARRHQLPVAACTVAQWTHGDVVPGITYLHTDEPEMDGWMEEWERKKKVRTRQATWEEHYSLSVVAETLSGLPPGFHL